VGCNTCLGFCFLLGWVDRQEVIADWSACRELLNKIMAEETELVTSWRWVRLFGHTKIKKTNIPRGGNEDLYKIARAVEETKKGCSFRALGSCTKGQSLNERGKKDECAIIW